MSALANSGGGVLLMGVADDGTLPGVLEPDKVVNRLAGLGRILSVSPDIDVFQLSKSVFIVYARIHPCPPCFHEGRIYHRVGSSSEPCTSREQLARILSSHVSPPESQSSVTSNRRTRHPSSGFWYVNIQDGPYRNWDDCRLYGFVSGGQGAKYSEPLKGLKVGARVFAYLVGQGYVGYGEVIREAEMIKDFFVDKESSKLLRLPLKAARAGENTNNPSMSEWVVGVKWLKSYTREEAKRFSGIFANQNMLCELRHPETVDFLKREFGIVSAGTTNASSAIRTATESKARARRRTGSQPTTRATDLPRIPPMFRRGIIKAGDILTIRNHEKSDAIVVDESSVRYGDQVMSYNEWGQKVTGWVNFPKHLEFVGRGIRIVDSIRILY